MGLFDSLKKVAKKIEDKVVEPLIKDAIPAYLAVQTGGASLAYVPPSSSGAFSSIVGSLGGESSSSQEQQEVLSSQAQIPVAQRQQLISQSIQGPTATSDLASSAQVGNNAPQILNQGIDSKTLMMFGGGAIGVVALMLMLGKKK